MFCKQTRCLLFAFMCSYLAGAQDNHESCGYWADIGECDANPGYMLVNCKTSCHRVQSSSAVRLVLKPCCAVMYCSDNPYCRKCCVCMCSKFLQELLLLFMRSRRPISMEGSLTFRNSRGKLFTLSMLRRTVATLKAITNSLRLSRRNTLPKDWRLSYSRAISLGLKNLVLILKF